MFGRMSEVGRTQMRPRSASMRAMTDVKLVAAGRVVELMVRQEVLGEVSVRQEAAMEKVTTREVVNP